MKKLAKIDKIAFCIFAALAALWAGGKAGSIRFPRTDPEVWYLMDAGSSVSNGCVHVRFTRNIIVPLSANIFVDGLDCAYTNESDWAEYSFNAYSNKIQAVDSGSIDIPVPAATNFNWIVYTDWVPSPIIHTNGVAYVVWQQGGATNKYVTYRTGVYKNGVRLAPNPWITNSPPMPAILLSTPIPTEANP